MADAELCRGECMADACERYADVEVVAKAGGRVLTCKVHIER